MYLHENYTRTCQSTKRKNEKHLLCNKQTDIRKNIIQKQVNEIEKERKKERQKERKIERKKERKKERKRERKKLKHNGLSKQGPITNFITKKQLNGYDHMVGKHETYILRKIIDAGSNSIRKRRRNGQNK